MATEPIARAFAHLVIATTAGRLRWTDFEVAVTGTELHPKRGTRNFWEHLAGTGRQSNAVFTRDKVATKSRPILTACKKMKSFLIAVFPKRRQIRDSQPVIAEQQHSCSEPFISESLSSLLRRPSGGARI